MTRSNVGIDAAPRGDETTPGAISDTATARIAAAEATTHQMARPGPIHVTPHAVLRQITESVQLARDTLIELTIDPPELGKVRMSMTEQGGAMSITIQSDTAATHDLFRRHQEILRQEFLMQGYNGVSFSFEQNPGGFSQNDSQKDPQNTAQSTGTVESSTPALEEQPGPALSTTGVDIRI